VTQHLFVIGFVLVVFCACGSAATRTNALAVAAGSSALTGVGYAKTGLEMMPRAGEYLEFWQVDQGVMIVSYSNASQKIVGLAFWFADERPKALRRTFEFDVASFDTSTGMMTIRTKIGEQGAAGASAQPAHD